MPFVMDKNDPQFEAVAIQCAEQCLSWARAIQQYASLNMDLVKPQIRESLPHPTQLASVAMAGDDDPNDDDDQIFNEQEERQSHGENLMNGMGL